MTAAWEESTIGDHCEVIAGQSPVGSAYNADRRGTPFYQGKKDFTEKYIGEPTVWTTEDTKIAVEGDILMSVRAPVGPVNFATNRICIGRGLAAIRPKSSLDREFLFYQLLQLQPVISGKEGAVFASINKADIEALAIVVPPLTEQKRIVAILDQALETIDTAITNTNESVVRVNDLFNCAVLEQFRATDDKWRMRTLPEVAKVFGRGKSKHRPRNDSRLYGGAYPFIQTGDVRNADHEITEYSQTYSDLGLAQSRLWRKGTVCITIAANIAETAVLGFDGCFPDSVIGFEADDTQTSGKYVEYAFSTVRQRLKSEGKGSAQDNINLASFEDVKLPFPDLTTQEAIVDRLDRLRTLRNKQGHLYERKLSELAALKQSLLESAFGGELRRVAA